MADISRRSSRRAAALALIGLLASALASDAGQAPRRIRFARGATSAEVKGTLRNGVEVAFVVGVSKGQTLSARLTSDSPYNDVVFSIDAPGGTPLMDEDPAANIANAWSGTLPTTGDYHIRVGAIEVENAEFTLEIEIR